MGSLLLLAQRARRPLGGAAAVPEHRSVGGWKGGEGAAPALLRRLQTAVPSVSPGAFEPAVRAHRAAERLGGDLARRRGHGGGEEEEDGGGGDDESGSVEDDDEDDDDENDDDENDDDATVGSVPRPPLRRGVIR